jgi:hypothetical protein
MDPIALAFEKSVRTQTLIKGASADAVAPRWTAMPECRRQGLFGVTEKRGRRGRLSGCRRRKMVAASSPIAQGAADNTVTEVKNTEDHLR